MTVRYLLLVLILSIAAEASAVRLRPGWKKIYVLRRDADEARLLAVGGEILFRYDFEWGTLGYVPPEALTLLTTWIPADIDDTMRFSSGFKLDPAAGIPATVPPGELTSYPSGVSGLYLIQLVGPQAPEMLDGVTAAGARIGGRIENNAYLVVATPEQAEQLRSLSYLQWIDPYHPFLRSARPNLAPKTHYLVRVTFPDNPDESILAEMRALAEPGEFVLQRDSLRFTATGRNFGAVRRHRLALHAGVDTSWPILTKAFPSQGPSGTEVIVSGQGVVGGKNQRVYFGSIEATFDALDTDQMRVRVPSGLSNGPVDILVRQDHGSQVLDGSSSGGFRVSPQASRSTLLPGDLLVNWLVPTPFGPLIRAAWHSADGDLNEQRGSSWSGLFFRNGVPMLAGSGKIYSLDMKLRPVAERDSPMGQASVVLLDAKGNYVVLQDKGIERYSSDEQLLTRVPLGDSLRAIDLAADQCTVFYASFEELGRVDICRGVVMEPLVKGTFSTVAVAPDGSILATAYARLSRFRPDGTVIAMYNTITETSIAFPPDAKFAWIIGYQLQKLDLTSGELTTVGSTFTLGTRGVLIYGGWTAARGNTGSDPSSIPTLTLIVAALLVGALAVVAVRRIA